MGSIFDALLDAIDGAIGGEEEMISVPPNDHNRAFREQRTAGRPSRADLWRNASTPVATTSAPTRQTQADEAIQTTRPMTPQEFYGVENPLIVFVTPSYKDEPPSNAMIGEIGAMQAIARLRNPDGSQAIELARWIPRGPGDLEGRLVTIDPLHDFNPRGVRTTPPRELHVRTDIDRVVAVIVRFPIAEAQFAQIQTVFCTYGQPRLIADFSNAGLYVDMKLGPSNRERMSYGASAVSSPYSVKVLSQFDAVRVPTQRIADVIKKELQGAA